MKPITLPSEMNAVVLDSYSGSDALRIEKRPVPTPGVNEVLVKVAASPINPSDLIFLEGLYGIKKSTPVVPGFEGSGVVVAAGSGLMAKFLVGKRVACISQDSGDGVWSEYMVTNVNSALPLNKNVSLEQGAMSVVNPMIVLAMLELTKKEKHHVVVQSAAASTVGQMVNRLFKRENIQVINIVRSEEQVELLKKQGVKIVLNSSDENFYQQLCDVCNTHKVRLGFDAVGGELTGQMIGALCSCSKVLVYGALSLEAVQAEPGELIFKDKSIEGFWLSNWINKKNLIQMMRIWSRAQKLMQAELASNIRKTYPLVEVQDAIKDYTSHMTGGKVLLKP